MGLRSVTELKSRGGLGGLGEGGGGGGALDGGCGGVSGFEGVGDELGADGFDHEVVVMEGDDGL